MLKPATNASHHVSQTPFSAPPLSNNLLLLLLLSIPKQSRNLLVSHYSQRKTFSTASLENIYRVSHSTHSSHFHSIIEKKTSHPSLLSLFPFPFPINQAYYTHHIYQSTHKKSKPRTTNDRHGYPPIHLQLTMLTRPKIFFGFFMYISVHNIHACEHTYF